MIIERNTFQAKYGQGDALVQVIREWAKGPARKLTPGAVRVCTDVTGAMFTVIWDMEHRDMAELAATEAKLGEYFGTPEFQTWFARMQPLIERGERQLLTQVDL
jgi:hypothetical protein